MVAIKVKQIVSTSDLRPCTRADFARSQAARKAFDANNLPGTEFAPILFDDTVDRGVANYRRLSANHSIRDDAFVSPHNPSWHPNHRSRFQMSSHMAIPI